MLKSFEEINKQGKLNYQEFEQKRLKSKSKSKKGFLIASIGGISLVVIGILKSVIFGTGISMIFPVVGLFFFIFFWIFTNKKAQKELKTKILVDLMQQINPDFTYSYGDKNYRQQFTDSGLIKYSGPRIDDVFYGTMNNNEFAIGEIEITSSDENSTSTIYQGLFAYVKTSNNYSFTSILPDSIEGFLGGFGKILQKANLSRLSQKLIRIEEDQNFEKKFVVWTKDEEQTRQILTPEFRNYLLEISAICPVYVGWRDNYIYFGTDNRKDLFNLKLKYEITEITLSQFYNDFVQYYNLLEKTISYLSNYCK